MVRRRRSCCSCPRRRWSAVPGAASRPSSCSTPAVRGRSRTAAGARRRSAHSGVAASIASRAGQPAGTSLQLPPRAGGAATGRRPTRSACRGRWRGCSAAGLMRRYCPAGSRSAHPAAAAESVGAPAGCRLTESPPLPHCSRSARPRRCWTAAALVRVTEGSVRWGLVLTTWGACRSASSGAAAASSAAVAQQLPPLCLHLLHGDRPCRSASRRRWRVMVLAATGGSEGSARPAPPGHCSGRAVAVASPLAAVQKCGSATLSARAPLEATGVRGRCLLAMLGCWQTSAALGGCGARPAHSGCVLGGCGQRPLGLLWKSRYQVKPHPVHGVAP